MFNGQETHCDAEKAVDDGSYKSLPDETLQKYHALCLNVPGSNLPAVERIRKKGDIIREELSLREERRREQQTITMPASDDNIAPPNNEEMQSGTQNAWDESRLLEMIRSKIEESAEIEYKSAGALDRSPSKISEITKDVSSMANSAGGTLIYGIAEFGDTVSRHMPERIDPIIRSDFSKEWLEHIVSQIRPRIPELRIYSVQLGSATDHVAYVVEIPQGTTAHQATDHRYYRRYNFEKQAMLDHEVRDVMNRTGHPRVLVGAKLVFYPRPTLLERKSGALIVSVENKSDVFARYVAITIHSPIRLRGKLIGYDECILDNIDGETAYRLRFSNHNSTPLFPRSRIERIFHFEFKLSITPEPKAVLGHFKWVVFADSMPMRSGTFRVDDIFQQHTLDS